MSKNLTRKGLAFGALVALSTSVIAGAPAQAAGIGGDYVTLTPATGSAYNVQLGDAFDLRATFANGVKATGQNLKFLVSDPNQVLRADTSTGVESTSAGTIEARTAGALADGGEIVTIAAGTATGNSAFTGNGLPAVGDYIYLGGLTASSGVAVKGYYPVLSRTAAAGNGADSAKFTIKVPTTAVLTLSGTPTVHGYNLAADGTLDANGTALGSSSIIGEGAVSARASDGSFVVDSGSAANDRYQYLRLVTKDSGVTTTQTSKITAWIDSNDNGAIDGTEYVSAERTVKWLANADIVSTSTIVPPQVGDTAIAGKVATEPALNGTQMNNSEAIRIVFTRQDAAVKAISAAATQNATTGEWEASVVTSLGSTDITIWSDADTAINASNNAAWGIQASYGDADGNGATNTNRGGTIDEISVTAAKVAKITTTAAHGLRTGDKVKVVVDATDSTVEAAEETTAVAITVTSSTTFTYTVSDTTAPTAATDGTLVDGTYYTVDTYTADGGDSIVDRVFAGTYSAQAVLETATDKKYATSGAAASIGTLAAAAEESVFSTVASAVVEGVSIKTNDASEDIKVKTGTLTLGVTVTALDKDGAALAAGRPVAISFANRTSTVKVNGKTASFTALTNDKGQVELTVTDTLGLVGTRVDITALADGVSTATSSAKVIWEDQAYSLYDLKNTASGALASETRSIVAGSSYDVSVLLADQWYQAPADNTYRIKATGSGVTAGYVALVSGKGTVKITDGLGVDFTTTLTLQKATSGVFADTTTAPVLTTAIVKSAAILIDADGASLYGSAAADLADAVAAVALVERDARLAFAAQPAYANDVVINGQVVTSTTNAAQAGSIVTISGGSNVLFSNGLVDKRGSLTIQADASGKFSVTLYSTTAQTDSVITVKANGVEKTVKVSFTGIGVGEGTSLTATAPSKVAAASTFQVSAKLADAYGNGVAATAGRVKVTYTGAGIVFGTLPDKTDATGALSFSALLGAADKGLVTVTVQYDQNGDADFVDAKDLTVVKSVLVGVSAKIAKAKNSVATVKNAAGLSITVVRGTKSKTVVATSNSQKVTVKGGTGTVKVYVNDILVSSKK